MLASAADFGNAGFLCILAILAAVFAALCRTTVTRGVRTLPIIAISHKSLTLPREPGWCNARTHYAVGQVGCPTITARHAAQLYVDGLPMSQ